jgi:hypothetical protein
MCTHFDARLHRLSDRCGQLQSAPASLIITSPNDRALQPTIGDMSFFRGVSGSAEH